jgi:flagellar hook-associated protein 3 FlgL
MAGSLVSLRDSVFYTANTRNEEGLYKFSGTAVTTATITYDSTQPIGSRYSFTGNTGVQNVEVGNGVTQPANVNLNGLDTLLNQLDLTITTLQNPTVNVNTPTDHAQVAAGIGALDNALNSVNGTIAALGGTQNILQTLDGNHANVNLSNQQAMLTLGQLDYGQASTSLSSYTTALQATQKAYAKVSSLSLFNAL